LTGKQFISSIVYRSEIKELLVSNCSQTKQKKLYQKYPVELCGPDGNRDCDLYI